MSSVRCRGADTAPVKKPRAAHSTGRLRISCQTLRSIPKGVASSCPSTLLPTLDEARIASVNTSATTKRLRISRAMPSIEWPA